MQLEEGAAVQKVLKRGKHSLGGFLPYFVRSANEGQNSEAPSAFPLKEREERNIPDSLGKCRGKGREGGRPLSHTKQEGIGRP